MILSEWKMQYKKSWLQTSRLCWPSLLTLAPLNITLTVSLSFHLLKRWSRKLTQSVAAILSYVLSVSQYLPLEMSPEKFQLWHQGSKEATRPRRAGELKGLGLSSLCVHRSWNTHGPQPEGKQNSVQWWNSETIPSSGLSAFSFLLFFPSCSE